MCNPLAVSYCPHCRAFWGSLCWKAECKSKLMMKVAHPPHLMVSQGASLPGLWWKTHLLSISGPPAPTLAGLLIEAVSLWLEVLGRAASELWWAEVDIATTSSLKEYKPKMILTRRSHSFVFTWHFCIERIARAEKNRSFCGGFTPSLCRSLSDLFVLPEQGPDLAWIF